MKKLAVLVAAASLSAGLCLPARATFPGHNGKILYSARGRLLAIDPDGSGKERLARGTDAAFNPSGSRIAYTHRRNLWAMRADGSHKHPLTLHAGLAYGATWSPGGRRIAYVQARDDRSAIWIVHRNGSHRHPVTPRLGGYLSPPSWSPGGGRLTFAHGGDVFVLRLNGRHLRRVTQGPATDYAPQWSPRGPRLLFERSLQGGAYRRLVVLDLRTGAQRRVAGSRRAGSATDATWSPRGTKIAYLRGSGSLGDLTVMGAGGSGKSVLQPADSYAWSPNGRGLAFEYSDKPPTYSHLGVVKLSGTATRIARNRRGFWVYDWQARPGSRLH